MDLFDDVLLTDEHISLEHMIDNDIRTCNLDGFLGDFQGVARFTPNGLSNSSCDLLARLSPSAALLDGFCNNLDSTLEHELIGNAWFNSGYGYGSLNYDQYFDNTLGGASILVNPQTGLPAGSVISPVTVQATITNVNIKSLNLVSATKILAPVPVQVGKPVSFASPEKRIETPLSNHVFMPVSVQSFNITDEMHVVVPKPKPMANGVRGGVQNVVVKAEKDIVVKIERGQAKVEVVQGKKAVRHPSQPGGGVGDRGFPKPQYSYSCLITMSLQNSTTGRLPVSEIYAFMCGHFPYFRTAPAGWKNSVRHNLSLNKCFQKIEKPPSKNGGARKGYLWTMHPDKVSKMQDEVIKWTRKDPQGIKKAMKKPETLELLEHGRMKFEPKKCEEDTEEEDDEYDETVNNADAGKAEQDDVSNDEESDDDSSDSADVDITDGLCKAPQLQRLGSYLNDILLKPEPTVVSSPDYQHDYPDIKVELFKEEKESVSSPNKTMNGKHSRANLPFSIDRVECRRAETNGVYASSTTPNGIPTKLRKISVA